MRLLLMLALTLSALSATAETADLSTLPFPIWNVVPPLRDTDDPRALAEPDPDRLPIKVGPVEEHVRRWLPDHVIKGAIKGVQITPESLIVSTSGFEATYDTATWDASGFAKVNRKPLYHARLNTFGEIGDYIQPHETALTQAGARVIQDAVMEGDGAWLATRNGLYRADKTTLTRHESYGVDGPLATNVTAVALDRRGALWTGSPVGIAVREPDGGWRAIRGREGLPVEDVTCIAIDGDDRLWIGTSHGLIHHRPYEEGRQWFYRESQRFLPHNHIHDIALTPDGRTVYTATEDGVGQLDITETTLLARAETLEKQVNTYHRRLGLVADAVLDDPVNPTSWYSPDQDNDGLWTAYHVAAMALAHGTTGDPAAKASSREGMEALYMLQDASGTPGLVARTVVTPEEAAERGYDQNPQWRRTHDGAMYWKSDTSADEIDGHYLAFYTYWEHIAKHDPELRARHIKQVREVTDYIVDNGYLFLDWDGERTRWGFWNPELLNNDPNRFLETGLNSLHILSFLKTAHYITGDAKYQKHYEKLIHEHGYLANVLLEKKTFPDSNNHSDNQLAYVAWYPILQLEHDPQIREQLHKAVRRHYKIIDRDRSAFFYFVTATIDPHYVDLESAVLNLSRIPTDRRQWPQKNSHRADVVFDPRVDRFGDSQLLSVLPVDERCFGRWNRNPYVPDYGPGGNLLDTGSAYLIAYWLGRHHGFFTETE